MFEVDRKGLADVLALDNPARFVFELIQNAWDEDEVTAVDVGLVPIAHKRAVEVIVGDDSPTGWRDISDAWTLFKPSYKKGDPTKRGRFNLGEKIVIAMARWASIECPQGTVIFEDGKRRRLRQKRSRGTVIRATMPWTRDEMKDVLSTLRMLIPPDGIATKINGDILPHRRPAGSQRIVLETIVEGEDGVLQRKYRMTDVSVYPLVGGEAGMIYEMGIPVVETGDPWHIDVAQKTPLTLDRKNLPKVFIRDVRAVAANVMAGEMTAEEATGSWADDALTSTDIDKDGVEAILEGRYGKDRVSYDPSDPEANKRATAAGHTVVHGGAFSREAWTNIKKHETITPAGQIFPSTVMEFGPDGRPPIPEAEWTPEMHDFAKFARRMGRVVTGKEPTVDFYRLGMAAPAASYGGEHLSINLSKCRHAIAEKKRHQIVKLLIHEFGHHFSDDHLSDQYHDGLCEIGATIFCRSWEVGEP